MIKHQDMIERHKIYSNGEMVEIIFGPVGGGSSDWFLEFRADNEIIFELKGTPKDINEKGFLLIDIINEANQER